MPVLQELRRVVNPKDGRFVETEFTDVEARNICLTILGKDENFSKSLIRDFDSRGLSQGQLYWLHKLALQHRSFERRIQDEITQDYTTNQGPHQPAILQKEHVGDFSKLTHLFNYALHYQMGKEQKRKATKLRITLELVSGRVLQLKIATEKSRYVGQLLVTNGKWNTEGIYYGRVDRQGVYHPSDKSDDEVVAFLRLFAENPQRVAQEYGRKTGRCCFCNSKLEDEKGDQNTQRGSSVESGYGLVCARRYGMYHTNLTMKEKQRFLGMEGIVE